GCSPGATASGANSIRSGSETLSEAPAGARSNVKGSRGWNGSSASPSANRSTLSGPPSGEPQTTTHWVGPCCQPSTPVVELDTSRAGRPSTATDWSVIGSG